VDPTPATYTWTVDLSAPTSTINQHPAQNDPTSDGPIVFRVVFSEAVSGFTSGDIATTFPSPA
jgi:hypothetical protein